MKMVYRLSIGLIMGVQLISTYADQVFDLARHRPVSLPIYVVTITEYRDILNSVFLFVTRYIPK